MNKEIEDYYINKSCENDTYNCKALLNVHEFCNYLGIGQSKARELLNTPRNGFCVRIGNRLYANKKQLDKWLDMQCCSH